MRWHELIFSAKKQWRLLRHILFWIVWVFYFMLCDYLYQQPAPSGAASKNSGAKTGYVILGSHLLLKTLLLVSIYVAACYVFIYLLLPKMIKGEWVKSVAGILSLSMFLYIAAGFIYWSVFPFVDALFGSYEANDYFAHFWPAVYLGLINPAKVLASAGIIKFVKYWWLKQRETEKLERGKLNAELQLLKAQIHPDFLFKTLNTIYDHAVNFSARTSGLLLKLSDLLSYMLYECNKDRVPLAKEMAMMKEYMELERTRLNDNLEMELNIHGEIADEQIAPFLLVPFIENSFKHCGKMTEQSWINLDIIVEDNLFSMKLANGISPQPDEPSNVSANGLANVQKRLFILYPGKHELKMTAEQEMFIVVLKIRLDDTHQNSFEQEKLYPSTEIIYE